MHDDQRTAETGYSWFIVEQHADSVKFTLPRRQLNGGIWIGLSLALPSLIGAVLLYPRLCSQAAEGLRMLSEAPLSGLSILGASCVMSLGLLLAMTTCFVGVMILTGRTRNVVIVKDAQIYDYVMFGPLWVSRQVPVVDAKQLSVARCGDIRFGYGHSASAGKERLDLRSWLGQYDHEVRVSNGERQRRIASYYPATMLDALLPQLKLAVENARPAIRSNIAPNGISEDSRFQRRRVRDRETTVTHSSHETLNLPSADGKRENTYITLHETESATAYEISRVGFFEGSKGLGPFSIAFAALWFGISIFPLAAAIDAPQFSLFQLGVTCFFGMCILVGASPVVVALNTGFRKALIAVTDEQVTIRRRSLLRTRQISIPKKSVFQLRIGFSGASVNDRQHREIQIMSSDGVRYGLLSQLPDAELNWLVGDLARRIGLHSTTEDGVFAADALTGKRKIHWAEVPSLPRNSAMQVQPSSDGLRIAIPPLGLYRASPYILLDLVLVIAGGVMIAWSGFLPAPLIVLGIAFMVGGLSGLVVVFYFHSEHVEITARAEELIVVKKRPWNQRSYCWKRGEVKSVDCVDTGFGRDSNPERTTYFQLLVVAHDSHRARHDSPSRMKLLYSRTPADIAYVAAVINSMLRKTCANK